MASRSRTGPDGGREGSAEEWSARPLLARTLSFLAAALPFVAAVVVSFLLSSAWDRPDGFVPIIGWLVAITLASFAAMVVTDRAVRRVLPLAVLLRLTLVFPDRAPNRFRTAMRSSSPRELERTMERVRREGLGSDVDEAAETLLVLVSALAKHDRLTKGHSERTRAYADLIAEEIGLSKDERSKLRWAALLHDVGKLYVPARILNKPGQLTDHEFDIIKQHPVHGDRLIEPLREWLGEWADTVAQHHERWDGGGYPAGIAGHAICRGARLVAVADTFDVMTSVRTYKRASTAAEARAEIAQNSGTQFDPEMVRAFLSVGLGRFRYQMAPLTILAQLPALRFLLELGRVTAVATSSASSAAATAPAAMAAIAVTGVVAPIAPPNEIVSPLAYVEHALTPTGSEAGAVVESSTSPGTGSLPASTVTTSAPIAPEPTTASTTSTVPPSSTATSTTTSTVAATTPVETSTTIPVSTSSTTVPVETTTTSTSTTIVLPTTTTASTTTTTTTVVPPTTPTTSSTVPPSYPASLQLIADCLGEAEPDPESWRLRPELILHGCTFDGADFAGTDLHDITFVGGSWAGAAFDGANLIDAEFDSLFMPNASFDGGDLTGTRFRALTLDYAEFGNATLVGTEFRNFSLYGADFAAPGPALEGVRFESGNLAWSTFADRTLVDVEILDSVNAQGSTFAHATFVGGWSGGDFSGALFNSSVHDGSSFQGADLSGAVFNGSDMLGADFSETNVSFTLFNGSDLVEVDFAGAIGIPKTPSVSVGVVTCPDGSVVTAPAQPLCPWIP